MARRTPKSMTDAELAAERAKLSGVAGSYAAKRSLAILDEQIIREGGWPLGFALVHPCLTSRDYVAVRVTKAGRRFTWVETLHERPEDRMSWRETTRGLWTFPTAEAAQAELAALHQSTRDYLARRQA